MGQIIITLKRITYDGLWRNSGSFWYLLVVMFMCLDFTKNVHSNKGRCCKMSRDAV